MARCNQCGAENGTGVEICAYCGSELKPEKPYSEPSMDQPEKILMQGLCNRVKSMLNVQNGKAILTNHRFIYLKHSFAKILAIGVFVNFTSGDYEFDIPLSDIQNIEDGRQGISKTIIINTKSGEKYNFYFTKREEWKIAIQSAVQTFK